MTYTWIDLYRIHNAIHMDRLIDRLVDRYCRLAADRYTDLASFATWRGEEETWRDQGCIQIGRAKLELSLTGWVRGAHISYKIEEEGRSPPWNNFVSIKTPPSKHRLDLKREWNTIGPYSFDPHFCFIPHPFFPPPRTYVRPPKTFFLNRPPHLPFWPRTERADAPPHTLSNPQTCYLTPSTPPF